MRRTYIIRLLRQRLQLVIRHNRRAPRLGRLVPDGNGRDHLLRSNDKPLRRSSEDGQRARGDGSGAKRGGA